MSVEPRKRPVLPGAAKVGGAHEGEISINGRRRSKHDGGLKSRGYLRREWHCIRRSKLAQQLTGWRGLTKKRLVSRAQNSGSGFQ